jgi:hypothetical protein
MKLRVFFLFYFKLLIVSYLISDLSNKKATWAEKLHRYLSAPQRIGFLSNQVQF